MTAQSIYLSSGAVDTHNIDALLDGCLDGGMRNLELASGLPCDEAGFARLDDAVAGEGFSYLIHNYFPAPPDPFVLNLASTSIEGLSTSKAHCRNAVDLCARFNVPFFSVHSGFALTVEAGDLGNPDAWKSRQEKTGMDVDRAYDIFTESVRELADYGAERGVRLLLENNVVSPKLTEDNSRHHGLLLSEGSEIGEFFRELNHTNVGLLLDTGHAKVSSTALGFSLEQFIDNVSDYIEAFHLSDNDGRVDSNRMFDGQSWFCPYLQSLPASAYVIEVYRMNAEQIRRQHQTLQEILA